MGNANRVLLIISGGIAAYKSLDLIRQLISQGIGVRSILTSSAAEFITPLSVTALSGEKVYTDIFSLTDESEMGHIQLSRSVDLVVVAPATANILARMAQGICDDLATTALLATDKPVIVAPAMNVRMWEHTATQENVVKLRNRGIIVVGPENGEMACGEFGPGRMAEPATIVKTVIDHFSSKQRLKGKRALVTSGPTYEPIDPVRFIANRSSGKQGHAIAAALANMGADTILVSGPTAEPDPQGVAVLHVESAKEMLAACESSLPANIAVFAAAVADWRPSQLSYDKLKKGNSSPVIETTENPDILKTIANRANNRPDLVIGFAAETGDVVGKARPKLRRKGCDWILANDVSIGTGTFGGDLNTIHMIQEAGTEHWPEMTKVRVADCLVEKICKYFEK
ncbi:MAG: bifunctional phosphopantothenoylcysteine decarboxylase/phosphopantothenate--cysteine ligase CoaBC [Rhodospirillaceae bacterium]